MWNDRKSIQLSLALVDLFGLIALVCACTMPMIAGWYAEQFGRSAQMRRVLTIAFYCCLPFAIAALGALHHLLHNLLKERPFIAQNVTLLRVLSWCCFAVALIALVACRFYLPFLLVCIAAAFIGLILRVIKNVFCTAIEIQNENDMII